MTDDRTPEISVAISLETMALLEMRMRPGDTYDKVIRALTEPPMVLEGIIVNLATAARMIRDDIARTVDLKSLTEFERSRIDRFRESAVSAIMKTENVVALDAAVKAVFDE